jgi:hypothetical protein
MVMRQAVRKYGFETSHDDVCAGMARIASVLHNPSPDSFSMAIEFYLLYRFRPEVEVTATVRALYYCRRLSGQSIIDERGCKMKRLALVLPAIFLMSELSAGTLSIGSVVSHGDLRIDHRPITVSGTVFPGSEVETGSGVSSSADVRLDSGARLTLYDESRGIFYRDHFVLLRGDVSMLTSSSFSTEAHGLTISPVKQPTTGRISIGRDGVVNVSAETGSFRVAKDGGIVLALVTSQEPLSFSPASAGQWQTARGVNEISLRDPYRCYVDAADDRDCEHHHHLHPSK